MKKGHVARKKRRRIRVQRRREGDRRKEEMVYIRGKGRRLEIGGRKGNGADKLNIKKFR